MIYLDNAGSTAPRTEIIDKFPTWLSKYYANAEATHALGATSSRALRQANKSIKENLNITNSLDIVWTGTATESFNLVIKQGLAKLSGVVYTTAIEHKAVLEPLLRCNLEVRYLPISPQGRIDIKAIIENKLFDDSTAAVITHHVNNEIGIIQPVQELGEILKKAAPRSRFILDLCQSVGKLPINCQKWRCDAAIATAHKFHGINGTAILAIYRNFSITALHDGGGQQSGLRSGTMNIPGAVAFAETLKLATAELSGALEKYRKLNKLYRNALNNAFGDKIVWHSGDTSDFLPHILSFAIRGFQSAILMRALGEKGIIIGTGSACMAESKSSSHVLQAIGVSRDLSFSTIRLSLGLFNSADEVDAVVTALQAAVDDY